MGAEFGGSKEREEKTHATHAKALEIDKHVKTIDKKEEHKIDIPTQSSTNTYTNTTQQSQEQKEEETHTKGVNPTERVPKSIESVLKIFRDRTVRKVRSACKSLKGMAGTNVLEACRAMQAWLEDDLIPEDFPLVVRPFFNWAVTVGKTQCVPLVKFLQSEPLCGDSECKRLIGTMFARALLEKDRDLLEEWKMYVHTHNIKISNGFVCELIKQQTRKGKLSERNRWEKFQKEFCVPPFCVTQTQKQTCTINTRVGREHTSKTLPSSVIVWNGNGVRARWNSPHNELKSIVNFSNPDLLCFLEAKTDSEKLLALNGFEEWVNEKGFRQIFCYWSCHEDKTARGCEGILIFSKVPCQVRYGMGNPEFDKQARVVTIGFPGVLLIISYNPQGGFSEKSIAFRESWEHTFTLFLHRVRERAKKENRKVIWAGDLNVNPTPEDWSERAFDTIRKKVPKGTIPIGCREQDQESYRRMVEKIEGANLGEIFAEGQPKRTCFQNEYSLQRNFGQRIDHVVAERDLLIGKGPVKVCGFEVLQQFGGGRKFCPTSAH